MSNDPVLVGLAENPQQFLDNLFRDAVTGMAVVDLEGRFRAVNPAFCRLLGRTPDQIIGLRPGDVTHPDERDRSQVTIDLLVSGERVTDLAQKRYLRPDGEIVTALRSTTVLKDRAGRPIGLVTQVLDMTRVARAQEAVQRSEARFRALVAHAWDITILLDIEGDVTYASPAAVRMLGHCPDELVGRSAFDFIHPDDMSRARTSFATRIRSAGPETPSEYRVRHRDGSWRDAEVVVTNLFDDPSVGALVLNVRDVTEEQNFKRRLSDSERRFRALVANSWDMISLHDAEGRYIYCSPAVATQLGYQPEDLIGTFPSARVHPDDVARGVALWSQLAEGQDGLMVEFRFPHKDGSWRWLESSIHRRLDDPAVAGIVVTTRDVTLRHRRSAQQGAIEALSSSALRGGPVETLFAQAVKLVAQAVDADYCTVMGGDGDGTAWTGADPERGAGGDVGAAESSAAARWTDRALREEATVEWDGELTSPLPSGAATVIAPASGPCRALTVGSRKQGAFTEDDISFLEAASNVLAAAITRDRMEHELREQALHDNLTGLPNRVLLQDRLATAMTRLERRPSSLAVLFVDLDNFKLVNDSLGHPAGDRLVQGVAERITQVTRSTDTVARFGGDEFVVLCEDTSRDAAAELAERIRGAVADPIELEERAVTITASIGIAVTSDPATTADDLLSMADTAMYAAKDAGKNSATLFASRMRRQATERLDALSGIRRGLENDEFRLHYQPIVSTQSGTLLGCEALVRWQHPTEGLVGPGHFIDYAETTGLILPLGEWVIRTACAQSAEWQAKGFGGSVSINVSGIQLTQSDIVSIVGDALERTGAAPGNIYLEVTENAVMSDIHRATAALEGLRELGVRIGMDDFGTGHSSLSQLAHLPFDFVKIDRSFVQRFDQDRRAAALLETIATLCRALELPATAEGVETTEQLEHLRSLGVPTIQGFLFGRPMAAADYERMVFERTAA